MQTLQPFVTRLLSLALPLSVLPRSPQLHLSLLVIFLILLVAITLAIVALCQPPHSGRPRTCHAHTHSEHARARAHTHRLARRPVCSSRPLRSLPSRAYQTLYLHVTATHARPYTRTHTRTHKARARAYTERQKQIIECNASLARGSDAASETKNQLVTGCRRCEYAHVCVTHGKRKRLQQAAQ